MSDTARAEAAPPAERRWDPTKNWPPWARVLSRVFFWAMGLSLAATAAVLALVILALSVAYPNLPDIAGLSDYRPKLPLRVLSADGVLLGEFGEERRQFTPIGQIPKVMKDAVLAIEDAHFYEHGGVDYAEQRKAMQEQISHLMGALRHNSNTAIILITHDLGVVAGLCDRVLVMYAGEAVECGSVEQIS